MSIFICKVFNLSNMKLCYMIYPSFIYIHKHIDTVQYLPHIIPFHEWATCYGQVTFDLVPFINMGPLITRKRHTQKKN